MRPSVVGLVSVALAAIAFSAFGAEPGAASSQAVVEIESASRGRGGLRAPSTARSGGSQRRDDRSARATPARTPAKRDATKARRRPDDEVRWHVVQKGQRLGSIAKRYRVPLDALLTANDLLRRDRLQPGERLVIPSRSDVDGEIARNVRAKTLGLDPARPRREARGREDSAEVTAPDARPDERTGSTDWRGHARRPKRKGFVTVVGSEAEFRGRIFGTTGRVTAKTLQRLERVFDEGDRVDLDSELLSVLVRVSDAFGGRAIHVVGGKRDEGEEELRLHRRGRAIDFAIENVPLAAVRDFCRTVEGVGVGFHSDGGYLHLDVRERSASWTGATDRSDSVRAPRSEERASGAAP